MNVIEDVGNWVWELSVLSFQLLGKSKTILNKKFIYIKNNHFLGQNYLIGSRGQGLCPLAYVLTFLCLLTERSDQDWLHHLQSPLFKNY